MDKPANAGAQDGPASRRRPLRVLPPQFVPMSPEQERQAVAALADLLLDYWNRHLAAEHGSPTPSPRPDPTGGSSHDSPRNAR